MQRSDGIMFLRQNTGAILILFAFIIPIALTIMGLVINISYQLTIKEELQNAAIAGAHAGAIIISKGGNAVKNTSINIIKKNLHSTTLLDNTDIDVRIGYYDPKYSRFTENIQKTNAVKILLKNKQLLIFTTWISKKLFNESAHVVAYHNSSKDRIFISQVK